MPSLFIYLNFREVELIRISTLPSLPAYSVEYIALGICKTF